MATSGSCRAAPTADRSPCSASRLAAARSLRSTFWLIQSVSTDSICQLSKTERLDKAGLLSDRIRRRRRDGVHMGLPDGFARSARTSWAVGPTPRSARLGDGPQTAAILLELAGQPFTFVHPVTFFGRGSS